MTSVVDASVALKWVLPEHGQAAARRLLDSGDDLSAPELLLLEAANALIRHVRLRSISRIEAASAYRTIDVIFHAPQASEPLIPSAFRLALELEHPLYDCIYLALAVETKAKLITADGKFVTACQRGGYGGHVSLLH